MSAGKILIVDDNATGRELLRDTIELEGDYEIITAANGLEALETVRLHMPDLILMDLHMPVRTATRRRRTSRLIPEPRAYRWLR
ncbi:MAG: response regulator [Chloroflexia bacterium]